MSIHQLFNDQWSFLGLSQGGGLDELDEALRGGARFAPVELPHDWLIEDVQNLYQNGTGWYRRTLVAEPDMAELEFEGVYMDCTIYINRNRVMDWQYGYSSFEVPLLSLLPGENELLVRVNHQAPNSRWYTGAGIYRDVWLLRHPSSFLVTHGCYITARPENSGASVQADTELVASQGVRLVQQIIDTQGRVLAQAESAIPKTEGVYTHHTTLSVGEMRRWEPETPCLYTLQSQLWGGDALLDSDSEQFGLRTVELRPDTGFWLNGRRLKLNGVCEHHDLGCLGAAYNDAAMRRRLLILREMGVNAVRTAHNMPAPGLMRLADELGILIVSEAFDMWERPKNTYDYARFFKDCWQKDVKSWVRRDRNHPSLIMWSIGNEIYDTHADENGARITRQLMDEVLLHDPLGHGAVTLGSNYMPWENAQNCADIVKIAGYNYSEKYYDAHHAARPDWVIYGSETASIVQSRGVYHFPLAQSVLADEDMQCSSLGNSTTSWGARSIESCIIAERDHPYSCGQFVWSGFDYIGEPTPYHTKNSYLGQLDTAGFPKDGYYLYQAEWTDCRVKPMVHIFPYWDFNDGQTIDIRVCSNAPRIELFFNGASVGEFSPQHSKGDRLVAHFSLPYSRGVLEAVAYNESGDIIARDRRASFGEAAAICLKPDRTRMLADGRDMVFVEISMLDADGNPVENANNRVTVTVTGAGRLVGLDNGDSTDYEAYKGTDRRLFSGKLLAAIAARSTPGTVRVTVLSAGLPEAVITLEATDAGEISGVNVLAENRATPRLYPAQGEDMPIRKLELSFATAGECTELTAENPTATVTARLLPTCARAEELLWTVVDDAGIPSNIASVTPGNGGATVTARGDGGFRLRCMVNNGMPHISNISQLDFRVTGLGKAFLDPYSFVAGGLYRYSQGVVGNGNERGFATARDGETVVGFPDLDFGEYGADEITLPIFALTGEPYRIELWEGIPGQADGCMVADVTYQKPMKWNVYQPETYKLNKRLRGITTLCFVLRQKVHIKGFTFTRINPAFRQLFAADCKSVYGDSFVKAADRISGIGNNVTIELGKLDFTDSGVSRVTVCGLSHIPSNSIHLRFDDGVDEQKQLIEFVGAAQEGEQAFALQKVTGTQTVKLVFLPGSSFDFTWLRFE